MIKHHEQGDAYQSNIIESLRQELVGIVEGKLTPIAMKYQYTELPLEDKIKWRPMVLVLGNYSSGKSTLINELLGVDVQSTGQAPTDDSFTVITYKDIEPPGESRDGMVLLNDPSFPFSHLKRFGQRFASHFKLKQLNSPLLKQVALIDTPGMLDSVAERDRGYDYQQVIAELASIADLILVLFDPHKAGTVRETYETLRRTLPKATYEDRIVFVLNRIDECSNLNDFLRVYGTLCWNLSQMTGRKDIPPIYLTHAENKDHLRNSEIAGGSSPQFLDLLTNQRADLTNFIMTAPRYRLDNLVSFIETHASRLEQLVRALLNFKNSRRIYLLKLLGIDAAVSFLLAGGLVAVTVLQQGLDPLAGLGLLGLAWFFGFSLSLIILYPLWVKKFHRLAQANLEQFVILNHQQQRDFWEHVKPLFNRLVNPNPKGKEIDLKMRQLRQDLKILQQALTKGGKEARQALTSVRF